MAGGSSSSSTGGSSSSTAGSSDRGSESGEAPAGTAGAVPALAPVERLFAILDACAAPGARSSDLMPPLIEALAALGLRVGHLRQAGTGRSVLHSIARLGPQQFWAAAPLLPLLVEEGGLQQLAATPDPVTGDLPVQQAALAGSAGMLGALLELGVADRNVVDAEGATLLHLAMPNLPCVQLLARLAPRLCLQPDGAGCTPLHCVAFGAHPYVATELAQLVLRAGANPRPVNSYGRTPAECAAAVQRPTVAAMLRELESGLTEHTTAVPEPGLAGKGAACAPAVPPLPPLSSLPAEGAEALATPGRASDPAAPASAAPSPGGHQHSVGGAGGMPAASSPASVAEPAGQHSEKGCSSKKKGKKKGTAAAAVAPAAAAADSEAAAERACRKLLREEEQREAAEQRLKDKKARAQQKQREQQATAEFNRRQRGRALERQQDAAAAATAARAEAKQREAEEARQLARNGGLAKLHATVEALPAVTGVPLQLTQREGAPAPPLQHAATRQQAAAPLPLQPRPGRPRCTAALHGDPAPLLQEPAPQHDGAVASRVVQQQGELSGVLSAAAAQLVIAVQAGLRNEAGEFNCFLNVFIQCLWRCAEFRQQVASWSAEFRACDAVLEALHVIFAELDSAAGTPAPMLDPILLRAALAWHGFDAGEMHDPAEVLLCVYETVMAAEAAVGGHAVVLADIFGLAEREEVHCSKCGKITHRNEYIQYFYNTQATALQMARLAAEGAPMGILLRDIEAQHRKTCDTDMSGCGELNSVNHFLQAAPCVFTLQVACEMPVSDPEALAKAVTGTLAALDEQLDLGEVYSGVPPGVHRYALRSMITYYGRHYQAFVYVPEAASWLMFDDARVSCVGSWADVRRKCVAGCMQPSVLFYGAAS